MSKLDEIKSVLAAIKVRLGKGELDLDSYRAERTRALAGLSDAERTLLGADPAPAASVSPRFAAPALRKSAPSLSELDLRTGTVLFEQWRIVRELGRGGFGAVFEAVDLHLGELQAVKILDPSMVARSGLLERFRREVKVMRSLQDRHILRVFDYREDAHRYLALISMELVAAGSLAKLQSEIPARSLPLPLVLRILRQVLTALQAAHAGGVIHRDVTPGNVMLAGGEDLHLSADREVDPDVRLADFGIAGMCVADELSEKTRTLGTATYVAPETFDPNAEITPAVDVYGAGAIAYELLVGKTPLVTGFRPASAFRGDLDPGIDALLRGMIATSPVERIGVAEALERLAAFGVKGTEEIRIPLAAPAAPAPATEAPAAEVIPFPVSRPRQPRRLAVPLALCAGLLTVGFAWGLPRVADEKPLPPPVAAVEAVEPGKVAVAFTATGVSAWLDGGRIEVGDRSYSLGDGDAQIFNVEMPAGATSFRLHSSLFPGVPPVGFEVEPGRTTHIRCQVSGTMKRRLLIAVDGRTVVDREYGLAGKVQKGRK